MDKAYKRMECRVCDRKAKWALTNIPVSSNPFLCGIHAKSVPYSTMFKVRLVAHQEDKRSAECKMSIKRMWS
jgi:hypothetical protein